MKHGKLLLWNVCLVLLSGCGHNVYMEREATGLAVMIPIGDSAIGFCLGSMKTASATVRGGVSLETASSASGGIFAGQGAESKVTTFKSNTQLNEKNLMEVFKDPAVPTEVKVQLAKNLQESVKAPKFMPSVLQTDSATIHMGSEAVQSNAVAQVTPHTTGLDKVVETLPQITETIVRPVTDLTDKTIDGVNQTIDNAVDRTIDWSISTKWTAVLLAALGVLTLWLKMKKSSDGGSVSVPDLEDIDPELKKEAEKYMDTGSSESPTSGDPSAPKDPAEPAPKKKETPAIKVPTLKGKKWWQKILIILTSVWTLIGKIPPETRARIITTVKEWWLRKKVAKVQKKEAQSK